MASRASSFRFMGSTFFDALHVGEDILTTQHLFAGVVHAQNQVKRSVWRWQPVRIAFGGAFVLNLKRQRVVLTESLAFGSIPNRIATHRIGREITVFTIKRYRPKGVCRRHVAALKAQGVAMLAV